MNKLISLISIFLLIGCNTNLIGSEKYPFSIHPNLPLDENGYFHLEMLENSSTAGNNKLFHVSTNNPNMQFVYWDCDTKFQYIWQNQIFEVDIINHSSYTNINGIAFTIFSPQISMAGDTVAVWVGYEDSETDIEYSMQISIILDLKFNE